MTETHATLRGSVAQMKSMLQEASLSGDTEHDDLYLQVTDEKVRIIQAAPGEVVLTYCTFEHDWFDDVDIVRDAHTIEYDNGDEEMEVHAEAILNVENTLNYLSLASDDGTLVIEFSGSTDRRLASNVKFEGAIETGIRLPGSQDALDTVPIWLVDRFTDDDRYTNSTGDKTLPTIIDTKVSSVQRIVEAVEMDRDADFYPISVEDGDFRMEVGEEERGYARGSLHANSVEGPDVENNYFDGFEEIFSVLSGSVTLQTAPAEGGAPLAVIQDGDHGKTIRHVNGAVNE